MFNAIMSVLFFLSSFFLLSVSSALSPATYYNEVPHGEYENYGPPMKYYSNPISAPLFVNEYSHFHEELMLNQIEQDLNFKIGAGVTQWHRLRMGNEFHLLGMTDSTQLNFVTIHRKQGNLFQGHLQQMEFEKNISTATIFKVRSKGTFSYEGLILVALPHPENSIMWYRINDMKIEALWHWKKDNEVREIIPFTVGNSNRLLIIEKSPESLLATVYEFDMDKKVPHYWLLENLPLRDDSTSPVVSVLHDGSVFFSVVHLSTGSVRVFEYKKICHGASVGNFQERFLVTDLGATSLRAFNDRKESYIAITGVNSTLYKLPSYKQRQIVAEATFGHLEEMMVVPVDSTRGDVVIFGKSKTEATHVFSRNAGWHEIPSPACKLAENKVQDMSTCFGGEHKWNGAVYIDLGDFPSLLFPNKAQSELFHLFFSLVPVANHDPYSVNWISTIGNELKLGWNELKMAFHNFEQTERNKDQESDNVPLEKICTIERELSKLAQIFVDAKLRLNSIDCSGSLNFNETISEEKSKYFIRAPDRSAAVNHFRIKEDSFQHEQKSEEPDLPNEITPELRATDSVGLIQLDRLAPEMYGNSPSAPNIDIFGDNLNKQNY